MRCPECGSNHTIKNGKDPNRNQRYLCKECGRNFVSSASTASPQICPKCQSNHTIKNGKDQNGNQQYLCKECGRNFVSSATTASQKVSWYQNKKTIIWIIVIVALIFFSFTGWFGLALLLSAIVWLWVYKKHPAQSAADMPSGAVCDNCGAQLPNSGVCPYCGGRKK